MRTFMPVNILIGAALLGGAGAAYASESEAIIAQDQLWSSDLKFDLLRDCPAAQVKRLNLPLPANGHTTAKSGPDRKLDGVSTREELGPSWTFQRGSNGPVLQFAALGAGKKERPGLAHLALDWNF